MNKRQKNTNSKITIDSAFKTAAEWRRSKRSARSFVDRYPSMYGKIMKARKCDINRNTMYPVIVNWLDLCA